MIAKEFQIFSVIILMIYSPLINGFCSDSIKTIDNKFRLIKLHYENLSGEKGLTTFFYNEKGIMHEAHWELLDGSRSSDNYYTYNEEENLIKKYRKFSDGITSTQIYEYDDEANLLNEHWIFIESWSQIFIYEYEELNCY